MTEGSVEPVKLGKNINGTVILVRQDRTTVKSDRSRSVQKYQLEQ